MCRRELEKQFSQRLEEVEVRFSGDQEAVSKRFEADVHKLKQHYQSEIAALAQQHAADRAHWEEESVAATKEAEQQWKLLREALKMENQCLELAQAQDIKALTDKNLQLQAELEIFVSAAHTKEIELSRQLNELYKDRMEAKDLLLAQAENKATELEEMLKQAVDDFIQERAELQWSLSALESRRGEVLSFTESMEQKGTIQEGEELLCQELKDERKALLAERDAVALRVVQLEGILLQLTGTTGEPYAGPLGEPCVESTEGIHAESIGDNCEETSKESTVQPFGELNQYTCTESTDEVCPKHLICEESSVNRDELEAGIMDEVTDSGLGDPQQHRCLEIGVTNNITSDPYADELDMSDVESNNSGTEIPDCACLIEEKEKTEENLSNPGVDGSEDAALNEELENAERNSTESQRDDTLEMAEEDIGTEIEAQILVENEASYNQESLQHHESPSTDDTLIEYNCKPFEPVIEDNPEVGISISSLENEIRAFANKVCSLTTVDTELDKVADFSDVCIQEILDLQETVMQYSKAAEGTNSQLQSPKRQYLDKENIIHQEPNRFDQMEASIKDVQLAELNTCFAQSIQENLQLVERNRNLEKRVKSLEGKMHVVLDLHKQQASVLEKTAQLRVEDSKLKVLLQELDNQDKVPQWDSDSSDTSNNSSSNSQLKEKIAAVAELEFFCMEFEKQNLQLRQELADLQDKSLRIHEQMQERRYHVMVPFVLL